MILKDTCVVEIIFLPRENSLLVVMNVAAIDVHHVH